MRHAEFGRSRFDRLGRRPFPQQLQGLAEIGKQQPIHDKTRSVFHHDRHPTDSPQVGDGRRDRPPAGVLAAHHLHQRPLAHGVQEVHAAESRRRRGRRRPIVPGESSKCSRRRSSALPRCSRNRAYSRSFGRQPPRRSLPAQGRIAPPPPNRPQADQTAGRRRQFGRRSAQFGGDGSQCPGQCLRVNVVDDDRHSMSHMGRCNRRAHHSGADNPHRPDLRERGFWSIAQSCRLHSISRRTVSERRCSTYAASAA